MSTACPPVADTPPGTVAPDNHAPSSSPLSQVPSPTSAGVEEHENTHVMPHQSAIVTPQKASGSRPGQRVNPHRNHGTPINAAKILRTVSHTYGRGMSPTPSDSSDAEDAQTEVHPRRQQKDMFVGSFKPSSVAATSFTVTGSEIARPSVFPPSSQVPSSHSNPPSINSNGRNNPDHNAFIQASKARSEAADSFIAASKARVAASRARVASHKQPAPADCTMGTVHAPDSPTSRSVSVPGAPPSDINFPLMPRPRSAPEETIRVIAIPARPATAIPAVPLRDMQPITGPTSPAVTSIPRIAIHEACNEALLAGALQIEDFESEPELELTDSLQRLPQTTPTRLTKSQARKGKAPVRNAEPGPSGEQRGRPPVEVNVEIETAGHRIQGELVELAEKHGLSYETLLRKVGFASQQEVRLPNLANMFRKVHKHRLVAINERKSSVLSLRSSYSHFNSQADSGTT